MVSYAANHPSRRATLLELLGIPRDPLEAHLWINVGVAPGIIYQLAEMVKIDAGLVCRLAGIGRSTVARKFRVDVPLTTAQGARVYGVAQVLEAVLTLHENDTAMAISWLDQPARGLGGVAPAELLTTSLGVQTVVELVGRIEHGVCQ